jgi:poly(A) polymerase
MTARRPPAWPSPSVLAVCGRLRQAGHDAYVTGGAVRDRLLGRESKDIDIVTNASMAQLMGLFPDGAMSRAGFDIFHPHSPAERIEIASFLRHDGGMPSPASATVLADDAAQRDFTVNALYYEPAGRALSDFHGGLHDLAAKTLRSIGNPAERFAQDPVRMLRAVRMRNTLGFEFAHGLADAILHAAPALRTAAPERVVAELAQQVNCGAALACSRDWINTGLHLALFPGCPGAAGTRFREAALAAIDAAVASIGPLSPGLAMCVLLWPQIKAGTASATPGSGGLPTALDAVLERQPGALGANTIMRAEIIAIARIQHVFEAGPRHDAQRLLQHPRLRAAYNLLQLRCAAGELASSLACDWEAALRDVIQRAGPARLPEAAPRPALITAAGSP